MNDWYEKVGRMQYIFLSSQAKLKRNLNSYPTSDFIRLAKLFLNLVPSAAWLKATVFAQPDPMNWKSEWTSVKIATYEQSCITEVTPKNDSIATLKIATLRSNDIDLVMTMMEFGFSLD